MYYRINSTHTFLAGGYVVVREPEDPLTNRIKPGSQDIVAAGAVPRRGIPAPASDVVSKDDGADIRVLVTTNKQFSWHLAGAGGGRHRKLGPGCNWGYNTD